MDLAVLQAARLKGGMADVALVAAATGRTEPVVRPVLDGFLAQGLIAEARGRYRITPEGRDALDRLLDDERGALDATLVDALYGEFVPLNDEFKRLVGDWQMRDDAPNDHADAAYDGRVVERLVSLHQHVGGFCDRVVAAVPRFAPYPERFSSALASIQQGDTRHFVSPLVDSYHQVWFEFHEDLIGAAGRNRLQEAVEGRAE